MTDSGWRVRTQGQASKAEKGGLTGTIPAELGELGDTLTRLRLAGNGFTGCVPAGLADVEDNDLDQLGLEICPSP